MKGRKKAKVLFLCTGNSCRSQMAEGWARELLGDGIEAYSAGVEAHGLKLEPASRRVSAGGRSLPLGPTEFKLLHFFMTHPERVYSRSQLLDFIWGDHVFLEERTVDVHIRRLRKALESTGHDRLIETVRSAGYRFAREE